MDTRKLREMNMDEKSILLSLELASNIDDLFNGLSEQPGGWVLKAIEKRFNELEKEVDKKIMIMILSIGDGIIDKCVKYVDDIVNWSNEFYHSKITWEQFTKEIYPHGIPVF